MPALWAKFRPSVQRTIFVRHDDLSQAQVTPFGGLLVIFGFLQDAPLDVVVCSRCVDFSGPRRASTVSAVPHRMLVRIKTLLEGLHGQTCVIPFLARRRDGCLVHYWTYLACAAQRAVLLDTAMTWPPTRVIFANSPPTPKDRAVVLTDHSCHIGHTTVTQRQRVGDKDFWELPRGRADAITARPSYPDYQTPPKGVTCAWLRS